MLPTPVKWRVSERRIVLVAEPRIVTFGLALVKTTKLWLPIPHPPMKLHSVTNREYLTPSLKVNRGKEEAGLNL
jgi:hypothetical protein